MNDLIKEIAQKPTKGKHTNSNNGKAPTLDHKTNKVNTAAMEGIPTLDHKTNKVNTAAMEGIHSIVGVLIIVLPSKL